MLGEEESLFLILSSNDVGRGGKVGNFFFGRDVGNLIGNVRAESLVDVMVE